MPNYGRIKIGDVGFVRQGRFHLLFSAGLPLGKRSLGVDVPVTFEPLRVGDIVRAQPRAPGCLRSATVHEVGTYSSVMRSATAHTSPESLSFELTGNRGAALVTKYPTFREDSLSEDGFTEYARRHYKSWVTFARDERHGDDVRPVLVSGFDMTRDFAMVAYSYSGASLESDLTATIPMVPSASASIQGTWRTRYSTHTNYGPQERILPEQIITDISSPQPARAEIPSEFNQCVFIRYYTSQRGPLGLFPKVIKVG